MYKNQWLVEAKCQNRNGVWGTFEIPFWGDEWDASKIAESVLSILQRNAPSHGLFVSDEDWKEEVLSHLGAKSINRVYQFGHCVSFNTTLDRKLMCRQWPIRSRHGFTCRPEDVPVVLNADAPSLEQFLQKFYEEQIEQGSTDP